MIKGMDEVKEVVSQLKACFEKRNGMKSIFFVACGGSLAASYPARYMLEMESLSLRVYGINSGEFVTSLPASVNESALVIAISTKATPETVEALALARKAGAVTVGMTGEADSLTAENADYKLVYLHADEWYKDPRLIHCNSQGTALKLAFELLNEFEGYPNYDKAMAALEMFPQIYATAYNKVKGRLHLECDIKMTRSLMCCPAVRRGKCPTPMHFVSSKKCKRCTAFRATAENISMARLKLRTATLLLFFLKAREERDHWTKEPRDF